MGLVFLTVVWTAFFVLFRRLSLFRRLPPAWGAIGAAVIVSAHSVHQLATTSPDADARRLVSAALLGAMAMVIFYTLTEKRRRA